MAPIESVNKYFKPIMVMTTVFGILSFMYATHRFYQDIDKAISTKVVESIDNLSQSVILKTQVDYMNLKARVDYYDQETKTHKEAITKNTQVIEDVRMNMDEMAGDLKVIKNDIGYLKEHARQHE